MDLDQEQLSDNPTNEEWDKWLEKHCEVDGVFEENLQRFADPEGFCISCQWWRTYNLDKDLLVMENGEVSFGGGLSGECWRFPPTRESGADAVAYPETTSNMTCGEWKAREVNGERTRLTKVVDPSVARHRSRNGEKVRDYRYGSLLPIPD